MRFCEVTCRQAQLQKNIDDVRRQRENLQACVRVSESIRARPSIAHTLRGHGEQPALRAAALRHSLQEIDARAQAAEENTKRREIEIGARSTHMLGFSFSLRIGAPWRCRVYCFNRWVGLRLSRCSHMIGCPCMHFRVSGAGVCPPLSEGLVSEELNSLSAANVPKGVVCLLHLVSCGRVEYLRERLFDLDRREREVCSMPRPRRPLSCSSLRAVRCLQC